MPLGTRAIARIPGAAGGGFANAKKLADLYVSSNTNDKGVISNPAVYDYVNENILAPFAGTVDGQNLIADYGNKKKRLVTSNNKTQTTVAALKEKEYSAWYVDDDNEDNSSFRNPEWVAQVTSESLDMIVAETVQIISEAEANGDSTAELNKYLNDLVTRSDRMRTVSTSFQNGEQVDLDGFGYYVDSDPNTGEIRGATFMPTDAEFGGITDGKKRTNSMMTVGNKRVPVYLPTITDGEGIERSNLGGVQYEYDGQIMDGGSDNGDIAMTERSAYQGVSSKIQLGNMYQSFSGEVNIDGSFKKNYIYVGSDNEVYKFSDDNPNGKAFLESMRASGAVGDSIPRLNPADVSEFPTQPLPDDTADLSYKAGSEAKMSRYNQEAAAYGAEAQRLGEIDDSTFKRIGFNAQSQFGKAVSGVKSFFGNKNKQNKPDVAGDSVDGQSRSEDVVDSGQSFFRNKLT